jgi:glutathione S-transferase
MSEPYYQTAVSYIRRMKLYGTTTSPFVRRVRVVAAETGVTPELVETKSDAGQALLKRISPIAKVPIAEVDGRVLFDSRVIIDWLTLTRGWGGLEPPRDPWHQANLINAIDGALESAIQVFYLRRDGLDVTNLAFAQRQRERITAIFDWLDGQFEPGHVGLAEISLACTLDWMEFRNTFEVGSRFAQVRALLAARPSLSSTTPRD